MPNEAPLPSSSCLNRPYSSTQKGGTLIASHVGTPNAQSEALIDPDRVRPRSCGNCGCGNLHVHERRTRVLAGHREGLPPIGILIFRCSEKSCRTTWRILPVFLARHLWRAWDTVDVVDRKPDSADGRRVPARTQQRWAQRLCQHATALLVLLAASPLPHDAQVSRELELGPTRRQVIVALGGTQALAIIAAKFHKACPGVRVM